MNNLYLAFSVVFPLFLLLTIGYVLRLVKIFNDTFLQQLNKLVFKFFLPVLLFINIYKSDFNSTFNLKLVLFAVIGVLSTFLILMLIIPVFVKKNENRSVVIQGIFRSNFIIFGIPMAQSLYGSSSAAITAVLIAFVVPLFNILAVFVLSFYSDKKISFISLIKDICKNTLIIGSVLAFVFLGLRIQIPSLIENTISDISKVATPLALIILGGSFYFSDVKEDVGLLIISVIGRLVVLPGICIPIAIALGFRGAELAALLALFASPTAVSSYTMAQNMNGNHKLAGKIVVFDSIFSILTIFIAITILTYNNFLQ